MGHKTYCFLRTQWISILLYKSTARKCMSTRNLKLTTLNLTWYTTMPIIRHNKCYSGFVKWMKSPNKDYIHDPTFRHSGLVSSSGVIWCWNSRPYLLWNSRPYIFVRWFHSFNKTRVALIMSDYIPGCDIVTNFSSMPIMFKGRVFTWWCTRFFPLFADCLTGE